MPTKQIEFIDPCTVGGKWYREGSKVDRSKLPEDWVVPAIEEGFVKEIEIPDPVVAQTNAGPASPAATMVATETTGSPSSNVTSVDRPSSTPTPTAATALQEPSPAPASEAAPEAQ